MTTRVHPAFFVPQLRAQAQILFPPDGTVVVRTERGDALLPGVAAPLVREFAALCDGVRSAAAIEAALADDHGREAPAALLAALLRAGVVEGSGASAPVRSDPAAARPVLLLGNGELLTALTGAFAAAGFTAVRSVHANGSGADLGGDDSTRLVISAARAPEPATATLDLADEDAVHQLLANADVGVCALEALPLRLVLAVNRVARASGTPCLFVTAERRRAVLGPTVVAGPGPCFHCRLIACDPLARSAPLVLEQTLAPTAEDASRPFLLQVAAAVVEECQASLAGRPARLSSVLVIEPGPEVARESLLPAGDCPGCEGPAANAGTLPALTLALAEVDRAWLPSPTLAPAAGRDSYRRVAVLGGGTAGYLSALALRAAHPHLEVTVIESSAIPVIGVGEATTPELVRLLHSPRFLGRDVADFHRRVRPTFKLGIRFGWGTPGRSDFPFPFQRGRLSESLRYADTLDAQSLGAVLMARHALPLFRAGAGQPVESLLHRLSWAYHLDNPRFVAYLQQEAKAAGIGHVDAVVERVECAADGENVTRVHTRDGRSLEADLWLDCSGFRSLLMGEALGSPFIDYSGTLFTDRAIAANVPHDGVVKPYTHARTLDAGWCWSIPFEDSDHCGYVFSSRFLDDERALEEMRGANPGLADPWTVRFRSGRHRHFWKGNVVALGNAYAFVEPLQSTALHMLVYELELLSTHFPMSRHEHSFKDALNRRIGERWDALRWFLGIHYRFNTCRDTAFWRAANNEADISGAESRVALFRERAPMSYRPSHHYRWLPPEFFSDDHAYDTMFTGLGLDTRRLDTVETRADFERAHAVLATGAATAMAHADGLAWLRGEGVGTLGEFCTRADSWIHAWYPA